MTDLSFDAAEITAAIQKNLEGFDPSVESGTVGRILEVGDGIARVSGLPDAAVNELLQFESGTFGLALNLDEDSIGAVVLGEVDDIEEGQTVRATGDILSLPVGDGLLGRVVNALGEPIDGKGPLTNTETRRMEIQNGLKSRTIILLVESRLFQTPLLNLFNYSIKIINLVPRQDCEVVVLWG